MDVIIVCHTEFGFVKNGKVIPDKNAVSGVKDGVLNLAKVAEKHGAKVSFAVCPEVVEYFPTKVNHEIGLHVHPGWEKIGQYFIGDTYLRKSCKQSSSSSVLWDYEYAEQEDMIKKGKNRIIEELGVVPKFFVAGRWCVNNDTIKALAKNGFSHDCSAPAGARNDHLDWSGLPRICMPFKPSAKNYQEKGNMPILITPVSQYFRSGSVNPEMIPSVGLSWLEACFTEYYRQKAPLFHICLHSPSMTDKYFVSELDKLLSFISKRKNINFKFATQIVEYPGIKLKSKVLPYILAINRNILKSFVKNKILKRD